MQWLNKVVEEVSDRQPDGEIIVESGVSPTGIYHVGTLREVLTADAIMLELHRQGRRSKHIHVVDDLDPFRKVPAGVSQDFKKYFGRPLCDIPAPDGSDQSYADFYFNDFLKAVQKLRIEMEVVRSHKKYRDGFMAPAIEKALENTDKINQILTSISGRKLDKSWSPIQVMEDEYLKSRQFVSIDKSAKKIIYLDQNGQNQNVSYDRGEVKLNWRIDWPSRWWLDKVATEPFGRDHATKGGSYDTGAEIIKQVFKAEAPVPVPYHFINRTGETKKMSKSTGNTVAASDLVQVLPPEVIRFFVFRLPPDRQLFFDESGVVKLIDDFSALLSKDSKSPEEQQLIELSTNGISSTVSNIPFSHLVAAYQAALRDPAKGLEIIQRTEHKTTANHQASLIKSELEFIDQWLDRWAPEEVKFELLDRIQQDQFNETQKKYLRALADKIEQAPDDADGEWFHKAIYDLKDNMGLEPKELFTTLYQALIGKQSGPRAGWFLSILPRDWLIKRLRFED